jgi:hypothetical protein
MSIFSNILNKLGFKKAADKAAPTAAKVAAPVAPKPAATAMPPKPAATAMPPRPANLPMTETPVPAAPATPKPAAPVAIEVVDVVGQLEKLSKGKDLDWKVSIVDLLKLLGLDSSFEARKELATELGCPADKMGDSAQMNIWLHKTVLQKLAENGGNIPKELLN